MADRLYASNVSATPPTPAPGSQLGYPKEGANPTYPGAHYFYSVMEELCNAIIAGGVPLSSTAVNQLAQVVAALRDKDTSLTNDLSLAVNEILPFGATIIWGGTGIPRGFIKPDGRTAPRSGAGSFPILTSMIDAGLLPVVSEAAFSSRPGAYTTVDNSSNLIRIPDLRSAIIKGHSQGSTIRTTTPNRTMGEYEADAILRHSHNNVPLSGQDVDRGGNASWFSVDSFGNTGETGGDENRVRTITQQLLIRAYW